jgi:lipopolysaccharide biosynthesis protein
VERQRSKVLKALSVALLYGYLDYALEIATRTTDLWTSDESRIIELRLRSPENRHDAQMRFPGRRHVAAALRRIWKRFQTSNDAWSVSDADLGNVD